MAKLLLFAGLSLLGLASASAQEGPPQPDKPMPMEWHDRMGQCLMGQKAAVFRFRKQGAETVIRCAEEEPTRACVDRAMMPVDKVAGNAAT